jgi:hypothetical protein
MATKTRVAQTGSGEKTVKRHPQGRTSSTLRGSKPLARSACNLKPIDPAKRTPSHSLTASFAPLFLRRPERAQKHSAGRKRKVVAGECRYFFRPHPARLPCHPHQAILRVGPTRLANSPVVPPAPCAANPDRGFVQPTAS